MASEPGAPPATLIFVNRYFHPDESATSQMLTDLAIGLAGRQCRVRVICSRAFSTRARGRLRGQDTVHGVDVRRVWTTRFGRRSLLGRALDYGSFYLTCAWRLWRTTRAGDVIIAKTDPPLISVVCAAVARVRGARLVNWQQDVFPEVAVALGEPRLVGRFAAMLTAWRDRTLAAADMNVVIGERMQEHFVRRGIPAQKLCVIANWSAVGAARMTTQSRLRKRLGLERPFVVCYSGNLGRAHEFETMLGAAERLKADPTVVFLIISEGARTAAFQREVAARGLRNVQFLPLQPRELLADSLSAADVHLACLRPELEGLVVPSKFYGILGVGRPVIFIGDPEGELGRLVDSSACGVAVAPGDEASLAAVIRTLRDKPSMHAAMGQRARALLLSRYTLSHGLSAWHGLLRRVLDPIQQQVAEADHDARDHARILRPS